MTNPTNSASHPKGGTPENSVDAESLAKAVKQLDHAAANLHRALAKGTAPTSPEGRLASALSMYIEMPDCVGFRINLEKRLRAMLDEIA